MLSAEKTLNLKPIKKVNIGNQVYEQMKKQILSGTWPPDEKIPSENQLMEIFGVSRTTVRQAIQKLAAIGYLETRRGEGSYVKRMGLENYFRGMIPASCLKEESLKELFVFRSFFECGVAEMAAKNASQEQIGQLHENLEKMLKVVGDLDKYIEIDFDFHNLLGDATHNILVKEIYKIMGEILKSGMEKTTDGIGYDHGVKCHQMILEAIENHDADGAREAMRYHMDKNVELYYGKL